MSPTLLEFEYLRRQILGVDSIVQTPFGDRILVYADYTASGRGLRFVEEYLMDVQRLYANTHSEDNLTGHTMTGLLHEGEARIKSFVNAGESGRIVCFGAGATAAIDKLQQMLGIALPPATRARLRDLWTKQQGEDSAWSFEEFLQEHQPVVFVGPYEHHSNEVTWREGLATTVPVDLDSDGGVNMELLDELLQRPEYQGRLKVGAFSAASNVSGMLAPVHDIAALLHRHGALACFDYAAGAAYMPIDMNPDPLPDGEDRSIDAIFISAHKFLGGPGSSGVLVFNEKLYDRSLPPTVGGGGTVDYVGYVEHDFATDVEEREKAGTPGVLQILRAALSFEIKERAGVERIGEREHELVTRAFARWSENPNIEILGSQDPERRLAILSFNLKDPVGRHLHPKLVTSLLNDLFGIQSRSGCSCAGPYGHRLLGIDFATSERYRASIQNGCHGIKPGWCRVSLHYVMDDIEADYILNAVDFLGRSGHLFLPLYAFDVQQGTWRHREAKELRLGFGVDAAIAVGPATDTSIDAAERQRLYEGHLEQAQRLADELAATAKPNDGQLDGEAGELQFFSLERGFSADC
jgi:selenocysteine lyase/cysteine desulfurase